jgi:hypothetical protein
LKELLRIVSTICNRIAMWEVSTGHVGSESSLPSPYHKVIALYHSFITVRACDTRSNSTESRCFSFLRIIWMRMCIVGPWKSPVNKKGMCQSRERGWLAEKCAKYLGTCRLRLSEHFIMHTLHFRLARRLVLCKPAHLGSHEPLSVKKP